MVSIGIGDGPNIASWMVDVLFGQPGQAKTDPAAAVTSVAAPAVAVASSARGTVSTATGAAIASLSMGGGDAAPESKSPDQRDLTTTQLNARVASNNRMTSRQISDALYSLAGLAKADNISQDDNDTFTNLVRNDIFDYRVTIEHADDPVISPDGTSTPSDASSSASLKTWAEAGIARDLSMQKAFDAHRLSTQKLSDIPGLHYTGYPTYGGLQDSAPTSGSLFESYDQQAMQDLFASFTGGKQAMMGTIGGVTLLLTWTEPSLTVDTTQA